MKKYKNRCFFAKMWVFTADSYQKVVLLGLFCLFGFLIELLFYGRGLTTEDVGEPKRRLENNEFQALKNYDPNNAKGAKESTYLHMLISSRLIDYFNSAKKEREISSEDSISNSYTLENEVNDYDEILEPVLETLTYEEQTYLQYRYNDELSFKQIGDIFGITHKQASKKVENIQIKLKRKLEKEDYRLEDII